MPRNPTPVTGITFNDGDLLWKMYAQTDFNGCTFYGTAKNCNFSEATFVGCTFDPAFAMIDCNIGGAEGLPVRFHPEPRRTTDERVMRPGFRPGM